MKIQAYPSRLQVFDLSGSEETCVATIDLTLGGRVKDFCFLQDLECGEVRFWAQAPVGYYRLRLTALSDGRSLALHWDRLPEAGLGVTKNSLWSWHRAERDRLAEVSSPVFKKEVWVLSPGKCIPYPSRQSLSDVSRLALGSHKKLDWDMVKRRSDLKEILPVWHRLGAWVKAKKERERIPVLDRLQEVLEQEDPQQVVPAFEDCFQEHFGGILSPRMTDEDFLGGALDDGGNDRVPLELLAEGRSLIESLFVQSSEDTLRLLPLLPPEFDAGRLKGVACGSWGNLDLEWSKKRVRRGILRVKQSREMRIRLPSGEKGFRLRENGRDQGRKVSVGERLFLQEGQHYFLDNFYR